MRSGFSRIHAIVVPQRRAANRALHSACFAPILRAGRPQTGRNRIAYRSVRLRCRRNFGQPLPKL
jgi:hypothetical protein